MSVEVSPEGKVRAIIAKFLKCKPEKVTPHAHLLEDLDADSLSLIEIAMGVEDAFGIDITDDEAEALCTLQQFVDHIEMRVKEKA